MLVFWLKIGFSPQPLRLRLRSGFGGVVPSFRALPLMEEEASPPLPAESTPNLLPPPPSSPESKGFPADPSEVRNFSAHFASLYHSVFPPKSPVPKSLSFTPSTSSSGEDERYQNLIGEDEEMENRLQHARLVLKCRELRNHYELCLARLYDLRKEAEYLRRENAGLQLENMDLIQIISSQATIQNLLVSQTCDRSSSNNYRSLNFGGCGQDAGQIGEKSLPDVSLTSVFENNKLQRQSLDRISLPKSISVRSSGYLKVNQPYTNIVAGGPSQSSIQGRIQNELLAGSQRVYVPRSGGGPNIEEEAIEFDVYNQGMLKTELCNKWQETGTCPYGPHCRFAHGINELRPVIRHPRYKTEVCRIVLSGETCPYGHRCHFRHSLVEQQK